MTISRLRLAAIFGFVLATACSGPDDPPDLTSPDAGSALDDAGVGGDASPDAARPPSLTPLGPVTLSVEDDVASSADSVLSVSSDGTIRAGWLSVLSSGRFEGRYRTSTTAGATWSE